MKVKNGRIFNTINVTIMLIAMIAVMIPLFSVISLSFVSTKEVAARRFVMIPQEPTIAAYRTLFNKGSEILNGYKITLFRVFVGTLINLLCSYFVGYALAKRDLPGRSFLTLFFFFTTLFSGGLVPTYIVVRSVNLINNIWVYILPSVMSVWNMLLIRNFIMSIPESLTESAYIDGSGDLRVIFQIILPLSIPALVTIGLFYAVGHWNSWWDAYLYTSKNSLAPIQLVLRNILERSSQQINEGTGPIGSAIRAPSRSVQNAAVVVTTLPIVILYPFLQKYFVKGVMVGAIKG